MAVYEDWWKDRVENTPRWGSTYQIPTNMPPVQRGITGTYQIPRTVTPAPSPASMPPTSPFSPSASAERGRTAARQRVAGARSERQTQLFPRQAQELPTTGGGGGIPRTDVSSIFAPLFQALDQQRANAESRYTQNAGQIQNIYGQLIGARTADIDDIETAYQRLQEAAASRGAATLEGMQGREAARLSQNEAVLGSMGIGDIGTSAGDIASQQAAVAQNVEAMNQSDWANLLSAMGATSQEIARADVTSFGYRQGEDIARLQAAREDYLQNVADQEFDLKFQQQQAQFEADQARAAAMAQAQAAAAKARQDAAEAAARGERDAYENFLRYSDPLTQAVTTATQAGVLTPAQAAASTDAYNSFMANIFSATPPSGQVQWNGASAAAAFLTSPAAEGLNQWQKSIVQQAIRSSF